MDKLNHFKETIHVIGKDEDLSIREAELKVEELKQLNAKYSLKTDRMQRVLDWLAQPVASPGDNESIERANATAILQKGYWEAISLRNKSLHPDIHQHLHIHNYEDLSKEEKNKLLDSNFS